MVNKRVVRAYAQATHGTYAFLNGDLDLHNFVYIPFSASTISSARLYHSK